MIAQVPCHCILVTFDIQRDVNCVYFGGAFW